MPNWSSSSMMSSTKSRLSASRSSWNDASNVTSAASTPSWSTRMSRTLARISSLLICGSFCGSDSISPFLRPAHCSNGGDDAAGPSQEPAPSVTESRNSPATSVSTASNTPVSRPSAPKCRAVAIAKPDELP